MCRWLRPPHYAFQHVSSLLRPRMLPLSGRSQHNRCRLFPGFPSKRLILPRCQSASMSSTRHTNGPPSSRGQTRSRASQLISLPASSARSPTPLTSRLHGGRCKSSSDLTKKRPCLSRTRTSRRITSGPACWSPSFCLTRASWYPSSCCS
ncbi:uncharacterized protein LOC125947280 [Dermacentor silvarum]|uniref:uncharacterized protein LOC125947280 n=1 Tax=Dermacentor silvarum TaxID=543639 RepID=UPI0021007D2F|nr:uncharacterized protein LOC125947280 [Dermacentor silvarum]